MSKKFKIIGIAAVLFISGFMLQNFISDGSQALDRDIAYAEEGINKGTIVVTGEGKVTAEPDMAMIRLGAEVTASSAEEAQSTLSKKIEAIRSALTNESISKDAIETAQFNVYPYHVREGEEEKFRAEHILKFELKNIEGVGDVLDAASKAGANVIMPVRFTLEDSTELEHKALKLAVQKTEGKADAMAEGAGKKRGAVLQLSEQGANIDIPVQRFMNEQAESASDSAGTVIEAGEVTIVQRVTVVYELN